MFLGAEIAFPGNYFFCTFASIMGNNIKLQIDEMGRKTIQEFKASSKTPIVVVLDNIRSLNNVGSVFRTCDALAVERLCLCGITACPPSQEIHKTALGAEDSMEWQHYDSTLDAIADLRAQGYVICSIEQAHNSVMLQTFRFDPSKKYAIIMGNEVKGVEQVVVDNSDMCIEIPQYGTKHSFNVSVTTGIVLWEMFRQWKFGE